MHTSLSKKLLAGLLSLVMVLSLVAPGMSTEAASKYSLTKKTGLTATSGVATTYYVKGVSKTQYIKVTGKATGVVVKYGSKTLKTTTKVNGTGKTLTLKVTAPDKNAVYTNKLVVKVYNKKTNKLVKTLTKSTKVFNKAKSITLSESEATLTVGDTLTLTATVDPAKGTRSQKWSTSDPAVATVEDGKVTAIAAGTATITLSIGSTTAEATITVKEALKAKQTGRKTITVTGSDLSDKVDDYTVKRGTVTVSLDSVVLSADKAQAELYASSATMVEGDYTLTFGEKEATFEVEKEALTTVEFVGNTLVLNAAGTQGTISFKSLNQFGERMTGAYSATCTLNATGSAVVTPPTTTADGVVTVALQTGVVAGQTGSATVVETTTGKNATATVTVGQASAISSVEVLGLYNIKNSNKPVKADEIVVGESANNYALLLKTYDQYGVETTGKAGCFNGTLSTGNVTLTTSGTSDLALTGSDFSTNSITVGDEEYVYVPFDSTTLAQAGTTTVTIVGNQKGLLATVNVTVAEGVKLVQFSISPKDTLYVGSWAEVSYTAIDSEGKSVTDYDTLKTLGSANFGGNTDFSWDRNSDGSATLWIKPTVGQTLTTAITSNTTHTASKSATVVTSVDKYTSVTTFTVFEAKQPVAVLGVKSGVATGTIADSNGNVTLKQKNFKIQDQYGNLLTDAEVATFTGYYIQVKAVKAQSPAGVFASTYDTAVRTQISGSAIEVVNLNTGGNNLAGTVSFIVNLTTANDTSHDVANSECTIRLSAYDIEDVTDFAISDMYSLSGGTGKKLDGSTSYTAATGESIEVTGTVNGTTVVIPEGDYVVLQGTYLGPNSGDDSLVDVTAIPALTSDPYTVNETLKVVIANQAGSEVTKEVEISRANSVVKSAYVYTATGNLSLSVTSGSMAAVSLENVYAVSQYGEKVTVDNIADQPRVTFSNVPSALTVDKNNTSSAQIVAKSKDGDNATAGKTYTVDVTLTFSTGVTVVTSVDITIL